MSVKDDQRATAPPPAGEDDAYSATTKVGAMPADIMEKLRAEGLLPEEAASGDRHTPVASMRPSTSLEKRVTAPIATPLAERSPLLDALKSEAPPPVLYSTAPPSMGADKDDSVETTKPPALTGPPAPLEAIETPVAFAFPPVSDPLPRVGQAAEDASDDEEDARDEKTNPKKGMMSDAVVAKAADEPPSKTTLYLVAAFVVIALIVALYRLRG